MEIDLENTWGTDYRGTGLHHTTRIFERYFCQKRKEKKRSVAKEYLSLYLRYISFSFIFFFNVQSSNARVYVTLHSN